MQPYNFTPAAIEAFTGYERTATPLARIGFRYLAEKLRLAEVYLLPDNGELLDRGRLRPEFPASMLKPPAPVVALEYRSPPTTGRHTPGYTEAGASRRIALAWDWEDDLPAEFRQIAVPNLGAGVVVASIAYFDEPKSWLPISAAVHHGYSDAWRDRPGPLTPAAAAMVASGQISAEQAAAKAFPSTLVPILPDVLIGIAMEAGPAGMMDRMQADLMDEVNAYFDFAITLACRDVDIETQPAPERLNAQRVRAGRPPLPACRTLKLGGLQ